MIEFSGKISNETKKYLLKKSAKVSIVANIIIFAIVFPIIVTTSINDNLIILLAGICSIIFFSCLPFMVIKDNVPVKIEIQDDILIAYHIKGKYEIRDVQDIKEIINNEKWYDINFYFPHKSICFICQKDLLTKGTIEEFESFFSNVLIKKSKN